MTLPPALWPHLALGLGGAFGWLAILAHAARHPERRLWPPRHSGVITVIWSWGLTIAIYVGLIRLGLGEGNALDLPDSARFFIGLPLTLLGSALQSWGTAALGLKGTSGWPVARCTRGPYRFHDHPQYIGQAMSFIGLALASGGAWVWIVASAGCLALLQASRREAVHLRALPS